MDWQPLGNRSLNLKTMNRTTLPTIHLNGTGAKSLFDEYHAAYEAVCESIEKLALATCHPRDFYPQGDNAWPEAREERDLAFAKLSEVKIYLEQWLVHLQNKGQF